MTICNICKWVWEEHKSHNCVESLQSELSAMKAESEWISVEITPNSRIGEGNYCESPYLTYDGHHVFENNFIEGNTIDYWSNWEEPRITHWKPMPPSPPVTP